MVELREVRQDRQTIRNGTLDHVFRIQQGWDAQMLFRHCEGQFIVLVDVDGGQTGKIAVRIDQKGKRSINSLVEISAIGIEWPPEDVNPPPFLVKKVYSH